MRILLLLAILAAAAPAAADYYECTGKDGHRWSGEPCAAGEKQVTYDSHTKQRKRDASSRPSVAMSAEQARQLPNPWGNRPT